MQTATTRRADTITCDLFLATSLKSQYVLAGMAYQARDSVWSLALLARRLIVPIGLVRRLK
jgi:hypothetical protein